MHIRLTIVTLASLWATSTFAQPPVVITPSATKIQQGDTVSFGGFSCAGGPAVAMFGDTTVTAVAGANADTWSIVTASLPPKIYSVRLKCGNVTSLPATVEVTAKAPGQHAIKLDPSPVRQGQLITVSGMSCADGKPTVMFDQIGLPATAGKTANAFEVDTKTLTPRPYKVTLRCGTTSSQEAALDVLAAASSTSTQPAQPTVTCVENLNPRDGWWDLTNPASPRLEPDLAAPPEVLCSRDVRWIVRMESNLAFHLNGFKEWREIGDNKRVRLRVFINGIEVANLTPRYQGRPDPQSGPDVLWTPLKFESNKDATDSRDVWAQILRISRANKPLQISIGPEGGPYWETHATIAVNSYPTGLSWFAYAVIAGLIVSLLWAAWRTPMLRDSNGATKPPFSLAKHQMAIWFVVVVSAYFFVMMTTGAAAATSATALILIGISGATGLTAVTIDKAKREAIAEERRQLEGERASLTEALDRPTTGLVAQLEAAVPGSPEAAQLAAAIQNKRERLTVVTGLLSVAPPAPTESRGWFKDLLSDENGISFHRLQIAVWTIVLVGTFVVAVWRTFAMPDFDATTLGLMGISSGMYLGFKIPEKPA